VRATFNITIIRDKAVILQPKNLTSMNNPNKFGKIIEINHKTQKVYYPAVIWQKNIISLQQINKQFKQRIYESNN
jgi:hypothetical protein